MNQDIELLLRQYRRKPICAPDCGVAVQWDSADLQRVLPHRPPMLLIDEVVRFDAAAAAVVGRRHLDPDDSIFAGHFPGHPVYPGNLGIEMIGQLGLCLHRLITAGPGPVPSDTPPLALRATKVGGALFLAPMPPGAQLTIIAKQLWFDGFTGSVIGQVIVDTSTVAVVSVGEVVFLA